MLVVGGVLVFPDGARGVLTGGGRATVTLLELLVVLLLAL